MENKKSVTNTESSNPQQSSLSSSTAVNPATSSAPVMSIQNTQQVLKPDPDQSNVSLE